MTDNKEKINKLDEKIKQLQAQKNSLIAREKEKDRKARTKNLIELGAMLNNLGITTKNQLNKLIIEYSENEKYRNWIDTIVQSDK